MSRTASHAESDSLEHSAAVDYAPTMPDSSLFTVVAAALLAGEPATDEIFHRLSRTLGRSPKWLEPLARRYVEAFAGQTRPRRRDVVEFLRLDIDFQRHWSTLRVRHWLTEPQRMQPVAAAAGWDVPVIGSAGDLADWLALYPGELQWFADLKALGYKNSSPKLWHYHYRILAKRYGNIRLIEAPKPRLKYMQRQVLSRILEKIPPHPAAHGFLKGRSIKTFIAPHVGQRVILRMDLRDFFPSICGARIQTVFRTMGYPESVADLLGGLCTNAVPREAWKEEVLKRAAAGIDPVPMWEARSMYARPHLPQGAPTSPALANLCAWRVDCRLAGLAKSAGATYSRYADDLAFSGGEAFDRCVARFATHAAAILHEEGFIVHHRKTRIMRQGVRQHLAGLVANQHVNVMRSDFDRLKATLTNCVRHGPESQNRDAHATFRAHLEGRVGFVESINPARGKRLRAIFEQIPWI